jgi:hypothetical protein
VDGADLAERLREAADVDPDGLDRRGAAAGDDGLLTLARTGTSPIQAHRGDDPVSPTRGVLIISR